MNQLFGLSMTYVAAGCIAVTAAILAFVALIAWRNPVMFKTGLRNIPRRRAQTALIIIGLMLSTVIITAAFGTGDTLTHSVSAEVYTILGPVDEVIQWDAQAHPAQPATQVIPLSEVDAWRQQYARNPAVKAFIPVLQESIPVLDQRTRLNQAFPEITATRPADIAALGGLKDIHGQPVTLGAGDIAINTTLQGKLDARVGDVLSLFYKSKQVDLTVKAVLPDSLFSGANKAFARQGAAVNFDFLSSLTGRTGVADFVGVSNDGTTRGGLPSSGKVTAELNRTIAGTNFEVKETKKDNVASAELIGNAFTTLFIVIGLFSIAAGVLLIFLIFVMLAAERKPEMGMARAVGAKRRQIVESFLAEGMGYDLGAAMVGLVAGVGVAAAMMFFIRWIAGGQLGLDLQFSVSVRSLIVSWCLGVITTFVVVFLASWRASRINIVAAIRDLPESKPANPEHATGLGYLRATLNGFAAFGIALISVLSAIHFGKHIPALVPVFLLAALAGVAGPWLAMLRGDNFGLPRDEQKDVRTHYRPLPVWAWVVLIVVFFPAAVTFWFYRRAGGRFPFWPIILGLVLLPVAGIGLLLLVGYPLSLLVVRLTRNRRPGRIPTWLLVLGVVVAPLGIVLAALQDRSKQVAWSVAVGTVGLVSGILLVEWGIDAQQMFFFATGASLILLWAAVTLRYFRIHERLSFSVCSIALLALWYALPGGRLSAVVGTLKGGTEMFFLSGATMVTAGTFLVVYNADVILPFIGLLGSRFGRILPAVKTAVAYPLVSRFRTGLTIAMIGLIMFVLAMQAALNTNFSKAFAGTDARGGFDNVVAVNGNTRLPGLVPALQAANATLPASRQVDTSKIAAVGEVRIATPDETSIKNPYSTKPADDFKRYEVLGVDNAFIDATTLPLQYRAAGYTTDRAVWDALKSGKNFAIIPDALTVGSQNFGPPAGTNLLELKPTDTSPGFRPFTLTFRTPGSGTTTTVTVIGQLKASAGTFWPGIVVPKSTLLSAFSDARGQEFFVRLVPGTNANAYGKEMEAALIGSSVDSLQQVIDNVLAINKGFLDMFQGFLALGLLVGIAALGVISFRAVVERRQQIGMLRAIGYQRRMVQLSFLLEAGFIAISGIGLGLTLGLTFAWSLFTSGEFGATSQGIPFTVPWLQVGAVTAFALVASLFMTYLPARAASHIAIAEALRYE